MNAEGTLCVSASSDGTVRLWSLGEQRVIRVFQIRVVDIFVFTRHKDLGRTILAFMDSALNVGIARLGQKF